MLRCWRHLSLLNSRISHALSTRAIRALGDRLVDVTDSPIKHVKILTMNNPPANTLSLELVRDILGTISELCDPDKDECRGIVLTSAIPGVFSTGWDLDALHTNLERTSFESYWSEIQRLHVTLNTLPVPLVSVINGHAIGIGCMMALASDYRVMAKKHGVTHLTIGVDAVHCGLIVSPFMAGALAHVVGHRRAEILLQLGELLETSVAEEQRLVDETVENADEALIPALMEIEKLSNMSPLSYWMAKDLSRKTLVAPLCTPALCAADCWSVYEMLNNPDVKRDLGVHIKSRKVRTQG